MAGASAGGGERVTAASVGCCVYSCRDDDVRSGAVACDRGDRPLPRFVSAVESDQGVWPRFQVKSGSAASEARVCGWSSSIATA